MLTTFSVFAVTFTRLVKNRCLFFRFAHNILFGLLTVVDSSGRTHSSYVAIMINMTIIIMSEIDILNNLRVIKADPVT